LQGILNPNVFIENTCTLVNICGPATSSMVTCRVIAEFSSSCTLLKRTLVLLDNNRLIIGSKDFPNGKLDVTIPFPPNYPANKTFYLCVDVERAPINANTMCGFLVKIGGTITCTYSP
jgi:hypothetical protein